VLYEKNADAVRAIASTGKVIVALTARSLGLKLDGETEITAVDRAIARGGARTRLPVGYRFTNHDLLRAMLVASDNRAPSALGRGLGYDTQGWLAAINAHIADLGLAHTQFTDPPGLRGNVSTARDMSVALRHALADPVLAAIMTTRTITIHAVAPHRRAIRYRNTNRSLASGRYHVLGGKTGYTSAARYCLLIAVDIDGRRVGMVFLGAEGKLTRYGDFNRVVSWIRDGMPNATHAVAR